MFNLTKEQKELITANGLDHVYIGKIVQHLKAEKYSDGDEIAIIRQKDEKPDEYEAYYEDMEAIKLEAKAIWAEEGV